MSSYLIWNALKWLNMPQRKHRAFDYPKAETFRKHFKMQQKQMDARCVHVVWLCINFKNKHKGINTF